MDKYLNRFFAITWAVRRLYTYYVGVIDLRLPFQQYKLEFTYLFANKHCLRIYLTNTHYQFPNTYDRVICVYLIF